MGKKQGKKAPAFRRILKLTPGRDERRLKLIWKGHVELHQGSGYLPDFQQMARWGWLEKHEPVDRLDAYYGYRPTALGLEYMMYDEKYHLILVKKEHVEAASDRALEALEVMLESSFVTFGMELRAHPEVWTEALTDELPEPLLHRAIERYERQGYMTLDRFKTLHSLDHEELIVCGILRYLEHRDPGKVPDQDVGPKAKHCLMCSSRWQTFFVRPGMEKALVELCKVEVRFIS